MAKGETFLPKFSDQLRRGRTKLPWGSEGWQCGKALWRGINILSPMYMSLLCSYRELFLTVLKLNTVPCTQMAWLHSLHVSTTLT